MNEIGWGIVGCGDVAEFKGGPPLYTAAGSRLVAVMSRRRERAADFARRHGADRHYDRLEALLADPAVDAVYLATPPDVHAEQTVLAAAAGKHVLCEKPMATTPAECERMIEACRAGGVQLMIAYYRRFFPVVVEMKRLAEEGRIGRVVRAATTAADFYRPRADGERAWLTDPGTAGGGFLTDVGVHRLDLLAFFLGPARAVAAFTDTLSFDIPVDDSSALALRFASGALATASFHWNVGTPIDEFELSGTRGRLLSRNLNRGDLEIVTPEGVETLQLPPPRFTHLGLVEHFVRCLREGRPNELPGEAGMQATRIADAAYRSSREGRTVRLEGDEFQVSS